MQSIGTQEGYLMATNAITAPELSAGRVKTNCEDGAAFTLKQRFEKLVREIFEGREEYLGLTPD
jgi:hypothetical protein